MQPHRTLALGRRIGGPLLLFVALLGIDVHAAISRADVMPQMNAAASEATSRSAPAMGDCMPCAYCYAGPAPTVHGFSGESEEQEMPGWAAMAKPAPASQGFVDARRTRPSPVPARVAYCRWTK